MNSKIILTAAVGLAVVTTVLAVAWRRGPKAPVVDLPSAAPPAEAAAPPPAAVPAITADMLPLARINVVKARDPHLSTRIRDTLLADPDRHDPDLQFELLQTLEYGFEHTPYSRAELTEAHRCVRLLCDIESGVATPEGLHDQPKLLSLKIAQIAAHKWP